jgi:hypothetical protein
VSRPKNLARAIGPALPLLLAGVGVVMVAFHFVVVRSQAMEFSRQGRRVIGNVVLSGGAKYGHDGGRSDRSYCTIGVNDAEIGWQAVQSYGRRPVGEAVSLLCLTSARRCMTAEQAAADLAVWPPNATLLMAAAAFVLAAASGLALRR